MKYSLRVNGIGRCETLDEDISQSLQIILFTPKGNRIYHADYGCDAMSYIDRPIWALQQLMVDIAKQVSRYEPRVVLERVEPHVKESKISIKLTYSVISELNNRARTITLKS